MTGAGLGAEVAVFLLSSLLEGDPLFPLLLPLFPPLILGEDETVGWIDPLGSFPPLAWTIWVGSGVAEDVVPKTAIEGRALVGEAVRDGETDLEAERDGVSEAEGVADGERVSEEVGEEDGEPDLEGKTGVIEAEEEGVIEEVEEAEIEEEGVLVEVTEEVGLLV